MRRFKKILCVVEPDKNSEAALAHAAQIASDHQADVTVASVLRISGAVHAFFQDKNERVTGLAQSADSKRSAIEKWVEQHEPKLRADVQIYTGIGFIEVVRSVIENQYDLVIKCADDMEWLDRLFGSDDMHLLRKCPCPVLILKPGKSSAFRNVLATVDVKDDLFESEDGRVQEELNRKVLEYSVVFSVSESSDMHIGSAWDAYAEDFMRYGAFSQVPDEKVDQYVGQIRRECEERLESLVDEMTESVGKDAVEYVRPMTHLVKGVPSKEIPLMVKEHDVDLVVMGTVARTGIPGYIIGNTAEAILEQVQCSVLAIKPDGFKSPVTLGR